MSKSKTFKRLALAPSVILSLWFTTAKSEPEVGHCKQYAENYTRQRTAGHVFKGAVAGAGAGALFGAFFGAAGAGAAAGAGFGSIAGGSQRSSDSRNIYTDAFVDCMNGTVTPP